MILRGWADKVFSHQISHQITQLKIHCIILKVSWQQLLFDNHKFINSIFFNTKNPNTSHLILLKLLNRLIEYHFNFINYKGVKYLSQSFRLKSY